MNSSFAKRIAIFIYGYGLGNSPSLINTGNILSNSGFFVDYFTYKTFIGELQFNNPKIRVYQLEDKSKASNEGYLDTIKFLIPSALRKMLGLIYVQLYQIKNRLFDKLFYAKRIAAFEDDFLNDIKQYVREIEKIIGKKQYECFIGTEPEGLIAAGMMGHKQGVPVIYYNLELHLSSESHTIMQKVVKKYEKMFNKSAVFTITQDEERAILLAKDNEIPMLDILAVPVCADGPKFDKKTDWLRKKFNLSEHDKVMLYAGFISDWAMCEELAKAAISWPENRILILHSHGYNDHGYIQRIKKYEGKKVKISLEPVSYEDLPSLLASADIGIALYKNLGKNFTLVGSASGKLSHYLKSGLPVITNDYPSMRKIIDFYECGVCIDSPQKITAAMEKIFNNYDMMRRNAYKCYEDRYMFSKHFAKVVQKIKSL